MLENLLRQRAELLGKLKKIAETCEGLENAENARRVTELNGRQAELLAQKDELKAKLSAVEGELGTISKNILDLSGSGVEKILQAIKNQRWYFFANNPNILMDRDTAITWANLNLFSYKSSGSFLAKAYSNSWGGLSDWKIPTNIELWKMIEDKSFPFQEGSNWRIKNIDYWSVIYRQHSKYRNERVKFLYGLPFLLSKHFSHLNVIIAEHPFSWYLFNTT